MERLIFDNEITEAAAKLLRDASMVKLAVVSLGKGAIENLKISNRKGKTQIICDLLSGRCDPNEVVKLMRFADVRTLGGLQSTVYLSQTAAIIGSENVSNGSGSDDRSSSVTKWGAAVRSTEPDVLASIHNWFDGLWAKHARRIGKKDLEAAAAQFKRQRLIRSDESQSLHRGERSILQVWNVDHEALSDRNLFVVWFDDSADVEQKKRRNLYLKKANRSPKSWGSYIETKGNAKHYRSGMQTIDCLVRSDGKVEVDSKFWMVPDPVETPPDRDNVVHVMIYGQRSIEIPGLGKIAISQKDRMYIAKNLKKFLASHPKYDPRKARGEFTLLPLEKLLRL